MTYCFNVILDEYIVKEHPAIVATPTNRENGDSDGIKATFTLIDTTLEEFGEGAVSVLQLGGWLRDLYGLLLLHPPSDRSQAQRIGICRWDRHEVAKLSEPIKTNTYTGFLN